MVQSIHGDAAWGLSRTTRKGVKVMPITITLHILGYTVTIRIKR